MKSTAIISKIRHFTNLNSRKLLYYSLVYPYLTYGNLIWGITYKTRIQKLINIQKKVIRLIAFKSFTEYTEPIFRDLEILSFEKKKQFSNLSIHDACDVTLSVYPHGVGLKNMPDHGGNRTYDLWNTSPMLCQLSYAVWSVRVCDISEQNLVPSISMLSNNNHDFSVLV